MIYGNIKWFKTKQKIKLKEFEKPEYKKSKLKYGWMPPHTLQFFCKKGEVLFNNYSENFPISGDYDFILKFF